MTSEYTAEEESRLKSRLVSIEKLSALEVGGVDNWEWYSESLEDFDSEDYSDTEDAEIDKLNFLENGGVDNWTWYDESLSLFSEYQDYVEATPYDEAIGFYQWKEQEEAEPELEENDEPEIEEKPARVFTESELVILDHISKSLPESDNNAVFERLVENGIWKRNLHPKEFDAGMKKAQKDLDSKNFLETARSEYVALLIKKGILDKLIAEV